MKTLTQQIFDKVEKCNLEEPHKIQVNISPPSYRGPKYTLHLIHAHGKEAEDYIYSEGKTLSMAMRSMLRKISQYRHD